MIENKWKAEGNVFFRGCPTQLTRLPSGRVNGSKNGNAANLSETAKFPISGMGGWNAGISNARLHGEAKWDRMHLGRLNQSPGRRNAVWSGTDVTAVKRELIQEWPGKEEHARKLRTIWYPNQNDSKNKKYNLGEGWVGFLKLKQHAKRKTRLKSLSQNVSGEQWSESTP